MNKIIKLKFYNFKIVNQIRLVLLVIPLVLLVILNFAVVWVPIYNQNEIKGKISDNTAIAIDDKINSIINERIGDLHTFSNNKFIALCLKNKTYSPLLVSMMDDAVHNYPLYDLFIAIDNDGNVIGTNSVNHKRESINTNPIYQINFKDSLWNKKAYFKNEVFCQGKNYKKWIEKCCKTNGYGILLSQAIYDETHFRVGTWFQFVSWERLIKTPIFETKASLNKTYKGSEILVIDKDNIIVESTIDNFKNIKIDKFKTNSLLHNDLFNKNELNLAWKYKILIPKSVLNLYSFLDPILLIINLLIISICLLFAYILSKGFSERINHFKHELEIMAEGGFESARIELWGKDEIYEMGLALKKLRNNMNNVITFAKEIGDGNLNSSFNSLGNKDLLGKTLLKMRSNLVDIELKLKNSIQHEKHASMVKSQFLSSISHELRTPLNAIVGITNILLQENPREDQVENLTIIRFSAGNLTSIIEDILSFSNLDAGKIHLEEIPFNLKTLVKNIYINYLPKAKENQNNLLIHFENTPDNLSIIGDPARITQILSNLINNALKFTENGQVKLSVNLLDHKTEEVSLEFSISDTGIGIEKEKLNEIFDHFSQASTGSKRKFGGIGMGLSLTKGLLELYSSNLTISSELGKGSIFSFIISLKCLPINISSIEKSDFLNKIDKSLLYAKKVLLVDDNKINLKVAQKLLEKNGCIVELAENGQIAVELYKEKVFDIVLMDLQMPIMDGYEASIEIRKSNQTIPIIAVTGEAVFDVEKRIKEAGINSFISKPYKQEVLLSIMIEYLNPISKL